MSQKKQSFSIFRFRSFYSKNSWSRKFAFFGVFATHFASESHILEIRPFVFWTLRISRKGLEILIFLILEETFRSEWREWNERRGASSVARRGPLWCAERRTNAPRSEWNDRNERRKRLDKIKNKENLEQPFLEILRFKIQTGRILDEIRFLPVLGWHRCHRYLNKVSL